ncbi:hypothetical protein D9E40_00705 [Escherichia coli]|nr:hypothetical protein [Escherichia coli]EEW1007795.1 hypothetical protein [Escherichia coli]EEY5715187.1 hypothetical protein [Escherichia coli]MHN54211.1 hypothetical protein [Escherichia coli]MHQ56173.1 hypothetical protein [Escherichia coli]
MRKRHSGTFRWVPVGLWFCTVYGTVYRAGDPTPPPSCHLRIATVLPKEQEKKTALRFLFLRLPQKGGEPVRLFPKESDLLIVQSIITHTLFKVLTWPWGF